MEDKYETPAENRFNTSTENPPIEIYISSKKKLNSPQKPWDSYIIWDHIFHL